MLDLITVAYGVDAPTVLGGPNWLSRNRFDVIAKAPEGTSREKLQLMLQSLLADRFKLVLHKDTKPVPGYVLTVGGTPKLKQATAPSDPSKAMTACVPSQNAAPDQPNAVFTMLSCHGATMESFARMLFGVSRRLHHRPRLSTRRVSTALGTST